MIYENVERLWYAQAGTFSTVYILTKKDMDKVVRKNYPQVIKEIERAAKDKYRKLIEKN